MPGCIIEDVKDRAAIGIISVPREAGGLPVPDIEAPEIDGESEYWRPSPEIDGMLSGADMRPCVDEPGPYICDLRASFSLLSSSF